MLNDRDSAKLKRALKKHSKNCTVYDIDKTFYQEMSNMWVNFQSPPERPDGYVYKTGTLLLLEHFVFDCTQKNKKGTKQQQLNAETERSLLKQEECFGQGEESEKILHSGKYYVNNLLSTFRSHVGKIPEYKQLSTSYIADPISKIIVGFVIEDATKLGFYDSREPKVGLNISQSKEFLDAFEKVDDLDFVLFTTTTDEDFGQQVFLTKKSLSLAREKQCEFQNIPEYQSCIQTYSFRLYIKK